MAEAFLDISDLRIEATVHPPGEPAHDIVIVDGVSLQLEKGRVLGLIGESGAGKSTIGLSPMGYGRGGVRITAVASVTTTCLAKHCRALRFCFRIRYSSCCRVLLGLLAARSAAAAAAARCGGASSPLAGACGAPASCC